MTDTAIYINIVLTTVIPVVTIGAFTVIKMCIRRFSRSDCCGTRLEFEHGTTGDSPPRAAGLDRNLRPLEIDIRATKK